MPLGSGSPHTLPHLRPGPLSLPIPVPEGSKAQSSHCQRLKGKKEKISVLDMKLVHKQGQRLHAGSRCPELTWHAGHLHAGKGGAHTPCGQVLSPGSGRGSEGLQGSGLRHHFLAQGCETQAAPSGLDTGVGRFLYFENSGSVCNCPPPQFPLPLLLLPQGWGGVLRMVGPWAGRGQQRKVRFIKTHSAQTHWL